MSRHYTILNRNLDELITRHAGPKSKKSLFIEVVATDTRTKTFIYLFLFGGLLEATNFYQTSASNGRRRIDIIDRLDDGEATTMPMRTLRYGACACQQADKRELALHNPQSGELLCSPLQKGIRVQGAKTGRGKPRKPFPDRTVRYRRDGNTKF